uniref:Uncharacterized protein n=1 Tax=Panagrolaimus sp. PS1159 TaxID=55785 RepID=A0AC35F319_9BILA
MGVKHFLAALIFVLTIYNVYSAVAVLEAELGKEVKLDFGKGMFLIKRRTKAFEGPQYLFASPEQDGTWTTDGKTKIPSTAHLYWNGTLVFKKFSNDDIGSYEMPLEASKIKASKNGGISAVANSLIEIVPKE